MPHNYVIISCAPSAGNLKEELQKYISLDELPAMYGGNRYAPDAECSDFIKPGQDVPPKYYLTNQMTASRDSMTRVVVGRGLVHEVCCEVAEVGSTLRWEFFSTDYDISFGVHMKKKLVKKTEKQTIVSWQLLLLLHDVAIVAAFACYCRCCILSLLCCCCCMLLLLFHICCMFFFIAVVSLHYLALEVTCILTLVTTIASPLESVSKAFPPSMVKSHYNNVMYIRVRIIIMYSETCMLL